MGTRAAVVDLLGLLRLVPDPAVAVDRDGVIIAANHGADELFETGPDGLIGLRVESLLPTSRRARHARVRHAFQAQAVTRPMGQGRSLPAMRTDGTTFQAEISLTPVEGHDGVVVAAVRDVSDRLRMESALRDLLRAREADERRYRTVLESLAEAIVLLDDDDVAVEHNNAAARLLGTWTEDGHVVALPPPGWRWVAPDGRVLRDDLPWTQVRSTGNACTDVVLGAERDGQPLLWLSVNALPLEDDVPGGQVVVSLVDVTARRRAEQTLSRMALTDPLTGLANRTLLLDRIEHDLALARRDGSEVALLFCDLDGFKAINDTAGHAIGDEVLRAVARRLRDSVRPADTVARIGGDEFVVLAPGVDGERAAVDLASRISATLREPLEVQGHPVVSSSIGIAAIVPAAEPDVGAEQLMRRADRAMYEAKSGGRSRWVLAGNGTMIRLAEEGEEPAAVLRRALVQDRFVVVYQPIVRLGLHRVEGGEALLRLRDPSGALVAPSHFIAHVEAGDLVSQVGRIVLRNACQAAVAWRATAPKATVAVNLSLRHLMSPDLQRTILEELELARLPQSVLQLEITESSLIAGGAVDRLAALRRLGLHIGLDDFGTGYASLTHLRSLPIDFLKVDRSFVAGLAVNRRDRTIVGGLLRLGQDLDLTVIVEGIETPEQEAVLLDLGATHGQGYLYGRPTDTDEVGRMLTQGVGRS